jgi:hypothetical protein
MDSFSLFIGMFIGAISVVVSQWMLKNIVITYTLAGDEQR